MNVVESILQKHLSGIHHGQPCKHRWSEEKLKAISAQIKELNGARQVVVLCESANGQIEYPLGQLEFNLG